MDETLVIKGVDLELLEEQRQALQALPGIVNPSGYRLSEVEADAVVGIINMLDYWADKRDGRVSYPIKKKTLVDKLSRAEMRLSIARIELKTLNLKLKRLRILESGLNQTINNQ